MEHIRRFNKKIEELKTLYPENKVIKLIERYRQKNGYKDFYSAIDSFGFDIKFSFKAEVVIEGSFVPCFVFYPGNFLNEVPGTKRLLSLDNGFRTLEQCYEFLAKEYIYRLMRIVELEELVNPNK